MKRDTNVKILYRNLFLPQCVSDVLTNLPNSVDAFYTISWLDMLFVGKKNDINSFYPCCFFYIGQST